MSFCSERSGNRQVVTYGRAPMSAPVTRRQWAREMACIHIIAMAQTCQGNIDPAP
jgi:hypothetical protein